MDNEIAESFRRDISNQTIFTLCNRLMLCSFAICLLWLTSLQVILGFNQSSIPAPYLQAVYDDCQFAYQQTATEKQAYFDCASREIKRCNENLQERYKEESSNALKKEQFNYAVMNTSLVVSQNCSTSMDYLHHWLHDWASMNSGGTQFLIPYQNCSASSLQRSKSFIGDSSSVKSAASSASSYATVSVAVAAHLSNYLQSEQSYEANYNRMNSIGIKQHANSIITMQALLYNKLLNKSYGNITNALTQVLACTSLSNTTPSKFCTYPTNMQALYLAQVQFVQNQNTAINNYLNIYKDIFDQYQSDVTTAISQMNQFYDSVVGSTGILRYIMTAYSILGGDLRQLCGKSTPNWCSFSPSSWLVIPPFRPRFPVLQGIDGPAKIWAKLSNVEKTAQRQIKSWMTQTLSRRNTETQGTEVAIGATTSAPYPSPEYIAMDGSHNSTHDVNLLSSQSKGMVKGVNDAISSLQTSSNGKNNTNGNYGSISNITASLAKVLERRSTPKTTWQSQSSGPIELQPVIDALSAILAFLIFTDTLYRVVITLKYFKNYWSRSIVDIPKVDLRQHSTADRIYEVVVAVEKAMHMMPFLLIQLALVIMLLAVTYAIAMYAYLPEYNSYVANCVRNEKGLNGTYLSKFVHQYAYDYAALDGNGAMVSGIARYNKKAAIQCSTAYGSSIQSLNDILTSISNANSSVQANAQTVTTLESCVRFNQLDKSFLETCCKSNYSASSQSLLAHCSAKSVEAFCPAFDSFLTDLQLASTSANQSTRVCQPQAIENVLQYYAASSATTFGDVSMQTNGALLTGIVDSRFNCSKLPTCQTTCTGPNDDIVLLATKRCSCMAEFYLNANFLKFVLSLLMYFSLNLSRMLLCKGLTMVFWHYLTVPEFEYSGTCKQSGSLVLPKIPKLNDPNRIQRRFLADWKRYWDSIGRHMKSMCNRVGCKGACLWRCGLRCLGLCCVPCALAIDVCCDSKDWKENCSASISRIRILIGIERTNTSLDDNDIESHTKGVKWDLDNIYNQENIHIPNEKNELLSENNSKVIDKNHTGSLSEIDSVKALLRRGLRKYELEGYGYIILSVLVNVPWIIINRNVSGQINYQ